MGPISYDKKMGLFIIRVFRMSEIQESYIKKCPKCGYERTQRDDAFVSPLECPRCGVFYEKELAYIAKQQEIAEEKKRKEDDKHLSEDKQRAEKELKEKNRQQNYGFANNHVETSNTTSQTEDSFTSSNLKKCPYCAEEIKFDAVKCRYCGEWLDQQSSKQIVSPIKSRDSKNSVFIKIVLSTWRGLSLGAKASIYIFAIAVILIAFGIIGMSIESHNKSILFEETQRHQPTRTKNPMTASEPTPQKSPTNNALQEMKNESQHILSSCTSACGGGMLFRHDKNFLESMNEEDKCRSKCKHDAMLRDLQIEQMWQGQKQRRQ